EQYLKISKKSECKRCVSPFLLGLVMTALHSTKKNIACSIFDCRDQEGMRSDGTIEDEQTQMKEI
ncbi:hypothetical protein PENTCL1PPCAC_4825, partial [Pristionchus entomophagus]